MKLTAIFTTATKTIHAAIEIEEKNSNSKINVVVATTGKKTTVSGQAHEVMMAIGAIADQGEDGLIGVQAV